MPFGIGGRQRKMIEANRFIRKLKSIRQGSSKHGNAPHKLILILTVIELIEKKYFKENKFYIDSVFVAHFKENWELLVNTLHNQDFTQPFYYLQNELIDNKPLWKLHTNDGFVITNYIKSINTLKEVVEFASFDDTFYNFLQNEEFRYTAQNTILDQYFYSTKKQYVEAKSLGKGYINDLTSYMLNERESIKYEIIDEESNFVRSGYFPKLIRLVYSSTCCMSGMKIITDFGQDLIEAAHIVPFSISRDDKVTNGLALCPNLHTAFDKGLLSLDDELKIMVSPVIMENAENPYSLSKLKSRKIFLPFGDKSQPDIENIRWHRKNIFKK